MPGELDSEIRSELSTLPRSLADIVARHLVVAGRLLDEDPERAYAHAAYARNKASRVGAVREASGLAAYGVGRWQEALADLRAARRMNGRSSYLAVMADCERGLGRPERALEMARSPEARDLDIADRIELRIVASGARRDMGEPQAALAELQGPELKERRARPWVARLFYAYADVLLELGREAEAREYFARASAVDQEGVTDADERLAEIEGMEIVDIGDDVVWSDAEDPDTGEEPEPARPEAAERTEPRPEPEPESAAADGEADADGEAESPAVAEEEPRHDAASEREDAPAESASTGETAGEGRPSDSATETASRPEDGPRP
ncbi:hypothetical protein [Marinitenerispora sediminis]|uniref:Tetratricopeptide repeat protein n=2 Tax=Marinitenerispora sediminis TaxID=1931232 RepID=A0A368T7F9_9ACTN|nr:hypothetical protein [Marinitenerispora sediminis]RCV54235.1 hypothetical protein DEF28_08640 [Marinitenerispora sediminis]RCV59521.1 hypothetical protein DEF24_09400 [Marinitenerispora sediminis]RCV59760.1 hypothetical protein DEF23_06320 [Marinitenerispora sediminis]